MASSDLKLKDVLYEVSRRLRRHPDSQNGVDAEQRAEIVGFIQETLGDVWEWAWWPFLMRLHKRTVLAASESLGRPYPYFLLNPEQWTSTTAYAKDDEVRWYGKLYFALQASTGQQPDQATTYWNEVLPAGRDRVGAVLHVYDDVSDSPDLAEEIAWSETNGVVFVPSGVQGRVWVEYRIECPRVTGSPWEEQASYAIGDVVYDTADGNCYECVYAGNSTVSPNSDTTGVWKKVIIPVMFFRPLVNLSAALMLFSDDRTAEAERLEQRGWESLEILRERWIPGRKTVMTVDVNAY